MLRLLIIILVLSGCQISQPNRLIDDHNKDHQVNLYQSIFQANQEKNRGHLDRALIDLQTALAVDPHSNFLNQEISSLLFAQGYRDRAIVLLVEFIKTKKANKQTKILLANLYLRNNQIDEAITVYDNLIKNSNNLDALTSRASLYFQHGKKVEAFDDLDLVLKIDNSFLPALVTYARILIQNKEFEKSNYFYERALKKNFDIQLALEFAGLLIRQKDYSTALTFYDKVLKYNPADDLAFGLKYICLIKLKQNDQADNLIKERRSFSSKPEKLDSIIANCLISVKSNNEAKIILKNMISLYQSNRAILTLALLEYEEKNYEIAENFISQINNASKEYLVGQELELQIFIKRKQHNRAIIKLNYLIKTFTSKPQWYLSLASLYNDQNDIISSENSYLEAKKLFPNNSEISFQYAFFLNDQKRINDAIDIMEKVLLKDPENTQALNFIGYSWAEEGQNLNKALEYTEKAASLSPDNGYILDSVGWCYYQLGQYPKALEKLLKANDLAKKNASIFEHIGDTYIKLNDKVNALKYYNMSLAIEKKAGNDITILDKKINFTLDGK